MFTLKLHCEQRSYTEGQPETIDDEETAFLADVKKVTVHRRVNDSAEMDQLQQDWLKADTGMWIFVTRCTFTSKDGKSGGSEIQPARLITIRYQDDTYEWVLAHQAWLLGPNGDTIERIAP